MFFVSLSGRYQAIAYRHSSTILKWKCTNVSRLVDRRQFHVYSISHLNFSFELNFAKWNSTIKHNPFRLFCRKTRAHCCIYYSHALIPFCLRAHLHFFSHYLNNLHCAHIQIKMKMRTTPSDAKYASKVFHGIDRKRGVAGKRRVSCSILVKIQNEYWTATSNIFTVSNNFVGQNMSLWAAKRYGFNESIVLRPILLSEMKVLWNELWSEWCACDDLLHLKSLNAPPWNFSFHLVVGRFHNAFI